jgi:ankyrin repeat protein
MIRFFVKKFKPTIDKKKIMWQLELLAQRRDKDPAREDTDPMDLAVKVTRWLNNKKSISLNIRLSGGKTPLLKFVSAGGVNINSDAIRLLVQSGANLDLVDNSEKTVWDYLLPRWLDGSHMDILEMFLARSENPPQNVLAQLPEKVENSGAT